MLPVTLVLVLALLTDSFIFYLVLLAALFVGLLRSGVTSKRLLDNFKPILILVIITSLYHLLFSGKESETLLELGDYRLTRRALEMAAFFSLRLVLFISIAFLVTLTSSPSELADAFARLIMPLERLRVPVQDLGLILFMAIRFIPVLHEEFQMIRNAQMIRGVQFSGSILHRIKRTVYILIPVFVAALQRADELALAMEARGYNSSSQRTSYSHMRIGFTEMGFMVISTAAIIALFIGTR